VARHLVDLAAAQNRIWSYMEQGDIAAIDATKASGAPPLGMLAAAQAFLWIREGEGPHCAKLHHDNDKRCIFCQQQAHCA
jgi:hypothetical protein